MACGGEQLRRRTFNRDADRADAPARPGLFHHPVRDLAKVADLHRPVGARSERRAGTALVDQDSRVTVLHPETIVGGDAAVERSAAKARDLVQRRDLRLNALRQQNVDCDSYPIVHRDIRRRRLDLVELRRDLRGAERCSLRGERLGEQKGKQCGSHHRPFLLRSKSSFVMTAKSEKLFADSGARRRRRRNPR